jgi:hypothetical protein
MLINNCKYSWKWGCIKMKIIIYMLVCMMLFPTVLGTVSSPSIEVVKSLGKATANRSFSHTILGEFFTLTTCEYCKYSHRALKEIYNNSWYPFYYITYVSDDNTHAKARHDELGIDTTPTVAFDSGYRKDEASTGVQESMDRYNTSILLCGNRSVADIDLSLNVTWKGAVNADPANGAINVEVEKNLSWTNTEMVINSTVHNNGASQYNGHLHIYVTEVNSSYWLDKFDDPYTFAFLDYAYNGEVSIGAGNTFVNSKTWDGLDYSNGYGNFFDEIKQGNTMVIASVFNHYNSDYTDETAGFRVAVGTDPKTFDVYFGNITPPPKVLSNTSKIEYNPPGNLEFNTTYYWKIDVWDNQGNPTYGSIWSFTTRPNNPPHTPYNADPANNSLGVPINTNLSWWGGDPDFDSVTYDVYFGKNLLNLEKVKSNQTETIYDPDPLGNLDFNTQYYWQIVAWDEYGLKASAAPIWNFRTQGNLPPNPPSEPFPENGANNIPITGVILSWNGSDPNPGDYLIYSMYFEKDDETPDVLVFENLTGMTWELEKLELYHTYYWKIVAWDSGGLSSTTSSQVWSFTTGINNPPTAPTITGPTSGKVKVEHNFTFQSTDPEVNDVYYYINWGDGTNSGWKGPYASGEEITQSHSWSKKGTFHISAKAKDVFGSESGWSETFPVKIPRTSQSMIINHLLEKLLGRFPYEFPMLKHLLGL